MRSPLSVALLILSIMCLSTGAGAVLCAATNLVTQPDSLFNRMPVMDQDGVGVCHAYTVAQLANFQLVRAGGRPSVHPIWAAIAHAKGTQSPSIQVGSVRVTVEQLRREGNCPAERVRAVLAS
jgi:hypothetical protein